MELRRQLDLYANVLHCVSVPTIRCRHNDLDIVMIRENTEGEYSGLEHEARPGIVESLKVRFFVVVSKNISFAHRLHFQIVTKKKIERISRFAFEFARAYSRKRITAVHKANIQKLGDGLFLKVRRV